MRRSIAAATAAYLLPSALACTIWAPDALGAGREYRRFEQDPARDNLRHEAGYVTGPPAALGRVDRRGEGPVTMVLIAGATFGGDVLDDFVEAHGETYTMYVVTLAGFGGTPAPPMPPEGTSYGEQTWIRGAESAVVRLIEEEKLSRPVIAGHWIAGADVAMRVALDHPDLVGGLIVLSGVPRWPVPGARSESLEHRIELLDKGLAPQWFKTVTEATWLDNNFLPGDYARHPVRGLQLWREAESVPLPVKVRYGLEARAQDLALEARNLRVPTLVVVPGFDDAFFAGPHDRGYMRQFCHDGWEGVEEANDRIDVVRIEGARVFLMDDAPDELSAALASFLGIGVASCAEPDAGGEPAADADPPGASSGSPLDRLAWVVPRPGWEIVADGAEAPEVATILVDGGAGRGNLTLQAVPDVPMSTLVPAIESATAAKYPSFEKTGGGLEEVDGHEVFRSEGTLELDGESLHAVSLYTKTEDGSLFGFTFRAPRDRMEELRVELERLLASVRLDGRRLVAVAGG